MLLQQLSEWWREEAAVSAATVATSAQKRAADKQAGQALRETAMQTLKGMQWPMILGNGMLK